MLWSHHYASLSFKCPHLFQVIRIYIVLAVLKLVSAVWYLSSAVSSLFYTLLQVFESLLTMPAVLKIDLFCHVLVFPPTLVHSGLPPVGLPPYNIIIYYTSICTLLCDFITFFHHLQTRLSVHISGLHLTSISSSWYKPPDDSLPELASTLAMPLQLY